MRFSRFSSSALLSGPRCCFIARVCSLKQSFYFVWQSSLLLISKTKIIKDLSLKNHHWVTLLLSSVVLSKYAQRTRDSFLSPPLFVLAQLEELLLHKATQLFASLVLCDSLLLLLSLLGLNVPRWDFSY